MRLPCKMQTLATLYRKLNQLNGFVSLSMDNVFELF